MTPQWDAEALWNKARLFLNHAMDPDEPRTFDERALWASLALELLGKAALSRRSPLLIAVPTEDGANLLAASGMGPATGKFTTIPASTLWSRCATAFRPFDERKAKQVAAARNEYLHGGAAVLSPIPESAWWPQFWALAYPLVHAQDRTLEELVGADRVSIVNGHLARNRRNVEHRAEMLIARARQRFAQIQTGDVPVRLAKEWERTSAGGLAELGFSADEECPACGSTGTMEGEDVMAAHVEEEVVDPDYWETSVGLMVSSLHFFCPTCLLTLDSAEMLKAAGLPDEFYTTDSSGIYFEPDAYGND
jgi:hypothetical protein